MNPPAGNFKRRVEKQLEIVQNQGNFSKWGKLYDKQATFLSGQAHITVSVLVSFYVALFRMCDNDD